MNLDAEVERILQSHARRVSGMTHDGLDHAEATKQILELIDGEYKFITCEKCNGTGVEPSNTNVREDK